MDFILIRRRPTSPCSYLPRVQRMPPCLCLPSAILILLVPVAMYHGIPRIPMDVVILVYYWFILPWLPALVITVSPPSPPTQKALPLIPFLLLRHSRRSFNFSFYPHLLLVSRSLTLHRDLTSPFISPYHYRFSGPSTAKGRVYVHRKPQDRR